MCVCGGEGVVRVGVGVDVCLSVRVEFSPVVVDTILIKLYSTLRLMSAQDVFFDDRRATSIVSEMTLTRIFWTFFLRFSS